MVSTKLFAHQDFLSGVQRGAFEKTDMFLERTQNAYFLD